ncbi:MAG: MBL fold metallo-hydrolase [Pseudomonadales bacterium]|nr:MBL fold metallo-hydrolase [Pseudomonadales bacterium]
MHLKFLGAAGTVTGSRTQVYAEGYNILVDCGLFQGIKNYRERNWSPFPVPARSLDAVVLTHAHLDHSGYLPVLVRQGFHGPIYCTPGTRDLCQILLPDAAHLQEEDAMYANHHHFSKHQPAMPLFTQADVRKTLDLIQVQDFGRDFNIHGKLQGHFSHAGHIIGASCLRLHDGEQRLVFSGDVGRAQDVIMRPPEPLQETDILIVESTYGDRRHDATDARTALAHWVNLTAAHGGSLIIPAFAVGRAQMALHLLCGLREAGEIPAIPIYLNSPMAIRATEVFMHHQHEHRLNAHECQRMQNMVTFVETPEESRTLTARHGPMIVVSASGMATGGRVLHHLRQVLPDHNSAVLFMGYQAPGTRGDALVHGHTPIRIHGEMIPVACHIYQLDSLSAHADYQELIDWLRVLPRPPRMTYINHGEPAASDALRRHLKEQLNFPAHAVEHLQTFDTSHPEQAITE